MQDIAKKELGSAVRAFLSPASAELGEVIADRVRLWRWQRAVRIIERASEIRATNPIKAQSVSLKFFLPFIEEASKEEDDSISEWWARLLASSSDDTSGFDLLCIDILKRISRHDADTLLQLANCESMDYYKILGIAQDFSEHIKQSLSHDDGTHSYLLQEDVKMFIDNLKRRLPSLFVISISVSVGEEWYCQMDKETIRSLSVLSTLGVIEETAFGPRDFIYSVSGSPDWSLRYLQTTKLGKQVLERVG